MRCNTELVANIILWSVGRLANGTTCRRSAIINQVENILYDEGYWEGFDDMPSKHYALKSVGEARIDWQISELKQRGLLLNPAWGRWRLAA